jgi:protease secretion system outer membrane protein
MRARTVRLHRWLAGMCLLLPLGGGAAELRFTQAFEAARANDPGYLAAQFALQAAREGRLIAQGSLMPQVSFSAGTGSTEGSRRFANGQGQDVKVALDYESPQMALTLRWPLFNMEGFAAVDQAKAQTELAEQQYRAEGQEMLDRLASAYLQVLAAVETQALARAQVATVETQWAQARQRQARGEGTAVQTAQAAANLEAARSRLIEAETQLQTARLGLMRFTGIADFENPVLPEQDLPPLLPTEPSEWVAMGVRLSPLVQVRERALDVARTQVRRQQAAHLPRLDVVGSLSRSRSDGVTSIGQTNSLSSVSLQLQVPLFSGGATQASVRQALARQQGAEEELRRERETASFDVNRIWQQMLGAQARLRSLRDALQASALAMRGAERAKQEGMMSLGDMAALSSADLDLRRQLAQTRLELLLARVRLQLRAGIPLEDIVADLERLWSVPTVP